MIKKKLNNNAKKIDKFLIGFLKKQKKTLLVAPMKYDVYFGMAISCATAILHRTDECIDYFS